LFSQRFPKTIVDLFLWFLFKIAISVQVLSENQRIARYLLDNLDDSVKIVEFDQVLRERKIGAGGFGEVFKGSLNGEEVAIKRVLDMDERKGSVLFVCFICFLCF
jgi:hypothetical protein